jgi:hypothetical protein
MNDHDNVQFSVAPKTSNKKIQKIINLSQIKKLGVYFI